MIEAEIMCHVTCDECGTDLAVTGNTSIENSIRAIQRIGWKVNRDGATYRTICPDCMAASAATA